MIVEWEKNEWMNEKWKNLVKATIKKSLLISSNRDYAKQQIPQRKVEIYNATKVEGDLAKYFHN